MRREQLTEKILDIKRHKGWSWKHITEEIGGVSPVLIVGALLGQMKLVKPLAKNAAQLFGLTDDEERMLNEIPNRGTPMPPTDPLLYPVAASIIAVKREPLPRQRQVIRRTEPSLTGVAAA